MTTINGDKPILYVLVVGFHHKKGCQIDYSYPPLRVSEEKLPEREEKEGVKSTNCLPDEWRTLPSLALPDGAHNHDRDTIFFHLPHPEDGTTVYGISCYRQIDADQLLIKSDDVTRGTVQKSVVVLSTLPLYGLIAAKCEMITHAYFGQLDFSKVDCVRELYDNLNGIITRDLLQTSEVFLELSPKKLVNTFQHKVLILFKLLLLEKKVLVFGSPVKELCTTLLTLCSLMPGMIEGGGLRKAASTVLPKPSLKRKFSSDIEYVECFTPDLDHVAPPFPLISETAEGDSRCPELAEDTAMEVTNDAIDDAISQNPSDDCQSIKSTTSSDSPNLATRPLTPPLLKLPAEACGLPLEIFRRGVFCHPYLSLTYLDVLSDTRVRGCLVGATNFLFKQRRNLFHVIVELDNCKLDIIDPDLKKILTLSTEDLRFADVLVKHSAEESNSELVSSSNGISWEGGDEWLRYMFKLYVLHLLRSSESPETSKEYGSFNGSFMTAWKQTHNYRTWSSVSRAGVFEVNPGHPCTGQLSMADMRLKLTHALNSDKGKKLSQTATTTGKAVSGAVTNAKSAMSTWWTTWKTSPPLTAGSASGHVKSVTETAAASASAAISSVSSTLSSFSLSSLLKAEAAEEGTQEEMKPSSQDHEQFKGTSNGSQSDRIEDI
ncbi:Late secretory pathway protein AVL9 -like protein [Halotydeus destructor]|nr:Late secretory pathway protein AVL9 -like protein [Halotydeus destructor]